MDAIPKPMKPSIDVCRNRLFLKARKSLELLPPTKDALALHLKRAAHQAMIWMKAADADFRAKGSIKYRLLGYRIGCSETSLDEQTLGTCLLSVVGKEMQHIKMHM